MHPIIQRDLMRVRVADLHREAERDRLAQAASGPRRAPDEHSRHSALSRPATRLVRRMLAVLGAHSLRRPPVLLRRYQRRRPESVGHPLQKGE